MAPHHKSILWVFLYNLLAGSSPILASIGLPFSINSPHSATSQPLFSTQPAVLLPNETHPFINTLSPLLKYPISSAKREYTD
ncbi:hypothetical protein AYI68_g2511 [Smittium mucronatum]|uniref:Uncharacterized protein n=1 Tax=Smittium mucronatum TaxID=133383 RepID=A0A1R0H2L4_9FUNG|nr:hypothetical protein AYI68_g2511 [Smittium mucronatum]